jgi:hypothetical protein
MNVFRKALASSSLLVLAALAGCAAQRSSESESAAPVPPAASAPGLPGSTQADSSLDQPEPATLAEAEAWLEKARADLDRLALNDSPPPASAGAAAPAEAPAPSPAPAQQRAPERAADKAEETTAAERTPQKEAPNPCETACKAFSSLLRASDAVCRLDTEGGQRCQRARQIQSDASRRVASCGCSK